MSEVEQHLFSMANEISCRDGDEVLLSLLEKCVVLGRSVKICCFNNYFYQFTGFFSFNRNFCMLMTL